MKSIVWDKFVLGVSKLDNRRNITWQKWCVYITVTSRGRHGFSKHRQLDCLFNRCSCTFTRRINWWPDSLYGLEWRTVHDDVIKWKHFRRYWPFVRGNHRSPLNSPHKGQWRGALMFSLIYAWKDGWVNNRRRWWFERPTRSLWRHRNVMRSREGYFGVFFPNLFLVRHIKTIHDDKTTILTHRLRVSLALFTFIWCHSLLLITLQLRDATRRERVKSYI